MFFHDDIYGLAYKEEFAAIIAKAMVKGSTVKDAKDYVNKVKANYQKSNLPNKTRAFNRATISEDGKIEGAVIFISTKESDEKILMAIENYTMYVAGFIGRSKAEFSISYPFVERNPITVYDYIHLSLLYSDKLDKSVD